MQGHCRRQRTRDRVNELLPVHHSRETRTAVGGVMLSSFSGCSEIQ
jgi:hypothetical protein